jgi:PEP-CTERM motif
MVRFAGLVAVSLIALAALSPTGVALAGVVVSVPEPGSLVLVVTGLGALGWVLRRR